MCRRPHAGGCGAAARALGANGRGGHAQRVRDLGRLVPVPPAQHEDRAAGVRQPVDRRSQGRGLLVAHRRIEGLRTRGSLEARRVDDAALAAGRLACVVPEDPHEPRNQRSGGVVRRRALDRGHVRPLQEVLRLDGVSAEVHRDPQQPGRGRVEDGGERSRIPAPPEPLEQPLDPHHPRIDARMPARCTSPAESLRVLSGTSAGPGGRAGRSSRAEASTAGARPGGC
jgi:hypothetical protein